jgi:DNA-binding SARP family transcriptional activator
MSGSCALLLAARLRRDCPWLEYRRVLDAGVRIQLCGTLCVERGSARVPEERLPGAHGRRLWAYLVLERGRPVARDELADAIWDDAIPDAWHESLHALASRLRAALRPIEAVVLRGDVGRYELRIPDDAFIDIERAWKALLRSEAALRAGDASVALAETLIARSIAERGFLAGEEGGWIEGRRRALRETLVEATDLAAEAELLRKNFRDAERVARAAINLDPLRESGYRLLMRALAGAGNGAQALHVMEECRAALHDQVGAAPSDETERVFREAVGLARHNR